jgi:hypothetical protein
VSDIQDIHDEVDFIKSNFVGRIGKIVELYHTDSPDNIDGISFSKKDVKWPGIPKSKVVDDFLQNQFDICFYLYQKETLPNEYLLRCSKSAFKLGFYHESYISYLDFVVEMADDLSTKEKVKKLLANSNKLMLTN